MEAPAGLPLFPGELTLALAKALTALPHGCSQGQQPPPPPRLLTGLPPPARSLCSDIAGRGAWRVYLRLTEWWMPGEAEAQFLPLRVQVCLFMSPKR